MKNFRDLTATELWCPRCKRAVAVRERLLLVLPDSDLYEYFCSRCSESLGKKTVPAAGNLNIGLVTGPGRGNREREG